MTRLLVSVRDAEEARSALLGGAHLIDVKEPARGALGAADVETIRGILDVVGAQAPVSVALGELADDDAFDRVDRLPTCQFAKLGLAGMRRRPDWRQRWSEALERLPPSITPVAVAYADARAADAPSAEEILEVGARFGCGAFLIDTWEKSSGSLVDHVDPLRLAALATTARAEGLLFVVAGSLRRPLLPDLVRANPDYVGVRGAVCVDGRTGRLDATLVRRLVADLAVLPIERPFVELIGTSGE